jgi:hypothetical protein
MNASQPAQINKKPDYVQSLEASFGAPSQSGFGSAVFYKQLKSEADLDQESLKIYQYFVGDTWERYGQEAWMSAWKKVYTRSPGAKHDVIAELNAINEANATLSVPMFLTGIENPEPAQKALARAFDDQTVVDLEVFTLGDGGAMSGILITGRRKNGETTFVTFLMD